MSSSEISESAEEIKIRILEQRLLRIENELKEEKKAKFEADKATHSLESKLRREKDKSAELESKIRKLERNPDHWLCPKCDIYDGKAESNYHKVCHHIANEHALDLFAGYVFNAANECPEFECGRKFKSHDFVVNHLAFGHEVIAAKLQESRKLNPGDFIPVRSFRSKLETFLLFRCRRCERKFVDEEDCWLHLALDHYFSLVAAPKPAQLWIEEHPSDGVNGEGGIVHWKQDDFDPDEPYKCPFCKKNFSLRKMSVFHTQKEHSGLQVIMALKPEEKSQFIQTID